VYKTSHLNCEMRGGKRYSVELRKKKKVGKDLSVKQRRCRRHNKHWEGKALPAGTGWFSKKERKRYSHLRERRGSKKEKGR